MPRPRVVVKCQVSGIDRTAAMIQRVGDRAHLQITTLEGIGNDVAQSISRVPVKSGDLAQSIKVLKVTGYFFVVGSDLKYSRYVREGTTRSKPHPYRVPPFARKAAEILSSRIIR
jgi:hypothetical protein